MSSFLVTVKNAGAWSIDGWESDRSEAERIATMLVTNPYMGEIAAVFEVGGTDALPSFTLRFQTVKESL